MTGEVFHLTDQTFKLIVRVLMIVILGTIAFGFLFELFIGGNTTKMDMGNMSNMGNMGNMGSFSNGILGNSFSGLFSLLINILFIVLIVAAVFALIMWVKKTYLKDTDGKTKPILGNDPIIRTAVVVVVAIIGLALLFGLLGSFGGSGMGHAVNSFNMSLSITGIINILIQILLILLVVSLVMGLVVYLKRMNEQSKNSPAKPSDPEENRDS